MLEKPNIPDERIISRLQEEYNLPITKLAFLPLGADLGTAVYRVVADDGTLYFLKLRKGFEEIVVTVPLFLKSQGIKEIIAPFETKSNQGWADFGEYKMMLYPFIEGKNGFQMDLTDVQVTWNTKSEKVNATTDHGMLILPDGPTAHRLYFTGTVLRQAQMAAVLIEYVGRTGLWPIVQHILEETPTSGDLRGIGPLLCPTCGKPMEEEPL